MRPPQTPHAHIRANTNTREGGLARLAAAAKKVANDNVRPIAA